MSLDERSSATSRARLTPPLKWHRDGGKQYLADKIISLMPRHLHYVEPYFGGGAVLLNRDPNDKSLWLSDKAGRNGVSEVVNDINGDLINFWQVVRSTALFEQFQHMVIATPMSRHDWDEAGKVLAEGRVPGTYVNCVDRAWAFFVRCRQSRAGTFKGFTCLTRSRTRHGINGNASEWLGAIDGLPEVHARLQPVVIEQGPALKLIEREDTADTLFYLDPPYFHETRVSRDVYAFEMNDLDHVELLAALWKIKGYFILSGYRSELYDRAAKTHGWFRIDVEIANHAAGGNDKRRMTECLWTNYEPRARKPGQGATISAPDGPVATQGPKTRQKRS